MKIKVELRKEWLGEKFIRNDPGVRAIAIEFLEELAKKDFSSSSELQKAAESWPAFARRKGASGNLGKFFPRLWEEK